MEDIQNFVDKTNPDFTFISEADYFAGMELCLGIITGYRIIMSKALELMGYTKIILLVKDIIEVVIKDAWMEGLVASIWVQVKRRGCKAITIGGVYQEHKSCSKEQIIQQMMRIYSE